jgi:hypothetical protein
MPSGNPWGQRRHETNQSISEHFALRIISEWMDEGSEFDLGPSPDLGSLLKNRNGQ